MRNVELSIGAREAAKTCETKGGSCVLLEVLAELFEARLLLLLVLLVVELRVAAAARALVPELAIVERRDDLAPGKEAAWVAQGSAGGGESAERAGDAGRRRDAPLHLLTYPRAASGSLNRTVMTPSSSFCERSSAGSIGG